MVVKCLVGVALAGPASCCSHSQKLLLLMAAAAASVHIFVGLLLLRSCCHYRCCAACCLLAHACVCLGGGGLAGTSKQGMWANVHIAMGKACWPATACQSLWCSDQHMRR